nr:MAG TPA: hypothetical protein [Caudoviricetes sp.]
MLDDFRELFQNTSNSTRAEFMRLTDADPKLKEAVIMSRDKLGFAYRQKHPDMAKKFDELSGKEKAAYADYVAKKLGNHISEEIEKVKPYTDASKSDPKGVKENSNRLRFLQNAQTMLQENLKPIDSTPYSEMSDYQKYRFGQEFGLNYFNDKDSVDNLGVVVTNKSDRVKLHRIATKLQEQAEKRRKFEDERKASPVLGFVKDVITPATQNARRRGEEPTWKDYALDAANIAATFAPGGLGLVSKFANAGKAAKAALAAGDVLANTATSTAIDARDLKGEDEDVNWSRAVRNLPKNLALSTAGTTAGAAMSREALPVLAKSTVGQVVPDIDTKLGKALTNEAVEARKAVKDYSKTLTLDEISKSNVYSKEVKDQIAKYVDENVKPDMDLLASEGIDRSTLDQIASNTLNASALDLGKETVAAKRKYAQTYLKGAKAARAEKKINEPGPKEAIMQATEYRLNQPDMQNLLEAETAVARKRNVPITNYQAIYSPTPLQKSVDVDFIPAASAIARSKIYGRDRQDPDAPWTVYTDPEYQKAKSKKGQYGDYQIIFLPDKFIDRAVKWRRNDDGKWVNIFGIDPAPATGK